MSSQGKESTGPAENILFAGVLTGAEPAAAAEHSSEAGVKHAHSRLLPADLRCSSAVAGHPSQLGYEPARAAEAPSWWPAGSNGQAATADLPGEVPFGAQSRRWTPQQELQSLGHKHLAWRLGAASEEPSLIAEALSASSTGASANTTPKSWKAWGLAGHSHGACTQDGTLGSGPSSCARQEQCLLLTDLALRDISLRGAGNYCPARPAQSKRFSVLAYGQPRRCGAPSTRSCSLRGRPTSSCCLGRCAVCRAPPSAAAANG